MATKDRTGQGQRQESGQGHGQDQGQAQPQSAKAKTDKGVVIKPKKKPRPSKVSFDYSAYQQAMAGNLQLPQYSSVYGHQPPPQTQGMYGSGQAPLYLPPGTGTTTGTGTGAPSKVTGSVGQLSPPQAQMGATVFPPAMYPQTQPPQSFTSSRPLFIPYPILYRELHVQRRAGGSIDELLMRMGQLEFELKDLTTLTRAMDRVFTNNRRIRPGFSSSWIVPDPPVGGKKLHEYYIKGSQVAVYQLKNQTENLYHLIPFEFRIDERHMRLIDLARQDLLEHYPSAMQLSRPDQARQYVKNYGNRTMYRLAKKYRIPLGNTRQEERTNIKILSDILAKYTVGMGITEIFLEDGYIQDVYIDAPASQNNIYVILEGFGDSKLSKLITGKFITNVTLGDEDAESLLSRFRYESGRPFSEAMPVLECDLDAYNTRVSVIGSPLSPQGTAFTLRRHATDPWTLLKLIYLGSMTPLAAGLLSFLVDGKSTILVAGSRGAGKTSLLGAIMLEFPQSQRILTIEDTLELPTKEMQKLGYKVQSMHIMSSVGGLGEMNANEALKVALRLGESAIILGEVRGDEARTLYEAMRAGTAGSSVLGTFHANSARAVFERVVHDLKIPPKAFNATDIIIVAGMVRPSGIQRQIKRIVQITEIPKLAEDGVFNDLMVYKEREDQLVTTDIYKYNSERIGMIAGSWGVTMEEAIRNIETRAKIKETVVDYVRRSNRLELLTARWVAESNNIFWSIIERHQEQSGQIDYKQLLNEWKGWFRQSIRHL